MDEYLRPSELIGFGFAAAAAGRLILRSSSSYGCIHSALGMTMQ